MESGDPELRDQIERAGNDLVVMLRDPEIDVRLADLSRSLEELLRVGSSDGFGTPARERVLVCREVAVPVFLRARSGHDDSALPRLVDARPSALRPRREERVEVVAEDDDPRLLEPELAASHRSAESTHELGIEIPTHEWSALPDVCGQGLDMAAIDGPLGEPSGVIAHAQQAARHRLHGDGEQDARAV